MATSNALTNTRPLLARLAVTGLAAAALVLAFALSLAQEASAELCIVPDQGPGQSSVGDYVAEAPVTPEHFEEAGRSFDNPAGKSAAWEADFNSPVISGPDPCEEQFGD